MAKFAVMNGDKPSVYVKRNKISELFDYCMDNGIEFNVKERTMGIDEFEVSMEVENIKKAIQLGIFLRDNRMDLAGNAITESKPAPKKPVARKVVEAPAPNPLLSTPAPEPKAEVKPAPPVQETKTEENQNPLEDNVSLSFDLN